MAKRFRFRVLGDVVNAQDVTGVRYEYVYRRQILDRGAVAPDGSFAVRFMSPRKKLRGELRFQDRNGAGEANFDNGGFAYSLAAGEDIRYRAVSKKRPQALSYAFSLAAPLGPVPPPLPDDSIVLSGFQDLYSDVLGGRVVDGIFVPNAQRFTAGADVVRAGAGTLGQADDLRDVNSNDGDRIQLATTASASLQTALTSLSRLEGVEHFVVSANGDASTQANFSRVSGLSSIRIAGRLTNQLQVRNALLAGARSFDFSGVTSGGIRLAAADAGITTTDALVVVGSAVGDILEASAGTASIWGGNGSDGITGSTRSSVTIAGEGGIDLINLTTNGEADVVSLVDIVSELDRDIITNFAGYGSGVNAFDRLRFNAGVFTNYAANTAVIQADRAQAEAAVAGGGGQGYFVVDDAADIVALNVSAAGRAWLALAGDSGELYYSSNGNFVSNRVLIATIDGFADFVAEQNVQIVA